MIAAAQAPQALEHLGLTEAAAVLDSRLEVAAQKQSPYAESSPTHRVFGGRHHRTR